MPRRLRKPCKPSVETPVFVAWAMLALACGSRTPDALESSATDAVASTSGDDVRGSSDGSTSMQGSSSSASDDDSTGTTAGSCEPGTLECACLPRFRCDVDLACALDTCIECLHGTFACPCLGGDEDRPGSCDETLLCVAGVCANPTPCPWENNGVCDEPQGTGLCYPGTDFGDCCPSVPGVCEDESHGGRCPDGSDAFDCCPNPMDGICDELHAGGTCPNGSDVFDCCATPEDGVCEEESRGGSCPDGSDVFDCCPSMPGVCEEESQGGSCPDGSDPDDCEENP